MKKFCIRAIVFSIPIFIGIIAIHLYVGLNPAIFRNKALYINDHKSDIETIFLGSSHTQDAINPLWMKNKCANLAYSTQDIIANCMLFDKYIEELPNLKFVFFELDYFTLEQPFELSKVNAPLYRKFYNLPKTSFYNQFSSLFSDLTFFRMYIYEGWKYTRGAYHVNDAGFETLSNHSPFRELHHDSTVIHNTASQRLGGRHKARNLEGVPIYTALIDSLIVKARSKDIQVVFLALPKYDTYIEREISGKQETRKIYLDQKLRNKEILYFDYEKDIRFRDVNLYFDDNHLYNGGSIKFTAIVDSLITSLK